MPPLHTLKFHISDQQCAKLSPFWKYPLNFKAWLPNTKSDPKITFMWTATQLFRLLPPISITIMSATFCLSKTECLLTVRAIQDMQKGRACLGTHC